MSQTEAVVPAETAPVRAPGGDRRSPLRRLVARPWFLPTVAAVVFLTAWELFGRAVNPILFSPPSRVASAFIDLKIGRAHV